MVTLSLMEGLRNRGHEVRCITSAWNDGRFEKRLEELSIPYNPLPLGFVSKTFSSSTLRMTLAQGLRLGGLWLGYRKATRFFRPDIVLHSGIHHLLLLWPLLGHEVNVFHVHDTFAPTPFYRRLFGALSRRVTTFVGVSKFVAESLINLGVTESKVAYVLNGIVVDDSTGRAAGNGSKDKKNGSEPGGPIRIGIVGQVDEWKGHEDLIDALHILEEKRQPFVCRIFGSGSPEFAAKLRYRIDEYKLANKVEWMGFVDDRRAIYGGMDVCVVPSRISEAFGMVAAEASMFGLPVIASRTGALMEVVLDDETGYIVDAKSPEQIAEKIYALSTSPGTLVKMGRSAAAHVLEALSAKQMIDKMEALFESLLSRERKLSNR
jgi:glycosyltransferase involved in cell wall biosynthesis